MAQSTSELNHRSARLIRKNRLYFLGGAVLVLGIVGVFTWGSERALYVRTVTGSIFSHYVVTHHIGQASVSDDASGFQSDFSVVTLNQRIPVARLKQEVETLAQQYYDLDGGTSLTVQYNDPISHRVVVQASTNYSVAQGFLNVLLRTGNGQQQWRVPENWSRGGNVN